MTLLENPDYKTLLQLASLGHNLLSLLESQDFQIKQLQAQIDAGLVVSDAQVTARIRAELQAQFDTAFNDALTLIGASTNQLATIRNSILGVQPELEVEPEPEPDELLIPNL